MKLDARTEASPSTHARIEGLSPYPSGIDTLQLPEPSDVVVYTFGVLVAIASLMVFPLVIGVIPSSE